MIYKNRKTEGTIKIAKKTAKKIISMCLFVSLFISLFSISAFSSINTVLAQNAGEAEYTLIEPLPCIGDTQNCDTNMVTKINLNDFVGYIFQFAIAVAVFLSVLMIMVAGFRYITTESVFGKVGAKENIQNALLGLLLALSSYLLLATIDPRLVDIALFFDPIEVDKGQINFQLTGSGVLTSEELKEQVDSIVKESGSRYTGLAEAKKILIDEIQKEQLEIARSEKELAELEKQPQSVGNDAAKLVLRNDIIERKRSIAEKDGLLFLTDYETVVSNKITSKLEELTKETESGLRNRRASLTSVLDHDLNKLKTDALRNSTVSQNPQIKSGIESVYNYYKFSFDANYDALLFQKKYERVISNTGIFTTSFLTLARLSDYLSPLGYINIASDVGLKNPKIEPGKLVVETYSKLSEAEKNRLKEDIEFSIKQQYDNRANYYKITPNEELKQKYATETESRVEYLRNIQSQLK